MITVRHTTIVHSVREALGLSIEEYTVADSINTLGHLSDNRHPGWYDLKKLMAQCEFFGLSEHKMKKIITELVYKDLAELGDHGIMITEKWLEAHGYGDVK